MTGGWLMRWERLFAAGTSYRYTHYSAMEPV